MDAFVWECMETMFLSLNAAVRLLMLVDPTHAARLRAGRARRGVRMCLEAHPLRRTNTCAGPPRPASMEGGASAPASPPASPTERSAGRCAPLLMLRWIY